MKAEDEKLAEKILAECAVINIEELQYKNEIQIIRPSEALEAMEAYHRAKLKEIATLEKQVKKKDNRPLTADEARELESKMGF